jgi:hypothetical protein
MLHDVEAEITKLESIADALRASMSAVGISDRKRTGMSAAARKKISLAQKARWAKTAANSSQNSTKPKRTMSASARRRIAAAQRARWAKVKAQQKKAA